jgi:hypothetical protein
MHFYSIMQSQSVLCQCMYAHKSRFGLFKVRALVYISFTCVSFDAGNLVARVWSLEGIPLNTQCGLFILLFRTDVNARGGAVN